MPISTNCPNCKALFRLPEEFAGKTVRCQKCAQMFVVPEGQSELVAPGASVAKEEPAAAEPPAPVLTAAPPPPPPPPPILARAVEKDEDEAIEKKERDEPPPMPGKRRSAEPRRRDEPAKSGSGVLAIVLAFLGLGILFCVVCAGVGVGFYVLSPAKPPPPKRDFAVRDMVKKDGFKFDDRKLDMVKIDRPKFDGPKFDGVKLDAFKDFKDGFKDGFEIAPPKNAPAIPLAFGVNGLTENNNILGAVDPVRNQKRYKLYSIRLEAGKNYQIDMSSIDFDAYLFLYDDANIQVAADDDSGGNLNARIIFTPQRTATYRIEATSFGGFVGNGNYTLTIRRN